jgi:sialidase-1
MRVSAVAAAVVAGLGVLTGAAHPAVPATPGCVSSVPYTAGTGGFAQYRIPAVIRAADGAVLAFAEARSSSSDTGKIETVVRRSADGGCTWGPQAVAASNGDGTAGNPSPVLLPSGRILLLTTHNAGYATEQQILTGAVPPQDSRRVFVQHSDDGGRTWSAATDITAAAKRPDWRWYATGPGHAIVLRTGPHAGRIVVACDHSSAPPPGSTDTGAETKYYGNHDLYSDDGGRTWRIGYTDDRTGGVVDANENAVAQLPSGALYFNARDMGTAPGTRVDGYSLDGGASLVQPLRPQPGLAGPVVEGSVLQTPAALVYAGPADPTARADLRLRLSTDGGHTWHDGPTLTTGPAAYSDLVPLPGAVGTLYETGVTSSSDTITFTRTPSAALR